MATWLLLCHGNSPRCGIQPAADDGMSFIGVTGLEENVKDFTSEKWEMVDLATQKSEKKNLPFGYD